MVVREMCHPTLSRRPVPLFNLSFRENGGGFDERKRSASPRGRGAGDLSGGALGTRARRATSDLRLVRERVGTLRQVVVRERGHVAVVWAAAALALFLLVRYG